jgi:N-acetyl-beta-hexosaminidase
MRTAFLIFVSSLIFQYTNAQSNLDKNLPIRGFCIAAPRPQHLAQFIKFIHEELAPRNVNALVLRVDFNYQYKTHPGLRDSSALSEADVKEIVAACKQHKMKVIPQINLLGHQSWASETTNLLRVYPQFDETPHVKMPEKYVWPNDDGLYCKSYCPLHPDVHKVVFALVDEICNAFETDAFHAGMDEVFYIGDDKCPRCSGLDKAELFANEVSIISGHLRANKRELWIWGDRLLDGKTTGLGMWEASMNNTHRAIDLIPKDVVICDWHYERPDKTAVYFAMKGFRVITCPWRNPSNAVTQLQDMIAFRQSATDVTKDRFLGMMQTVWSDPESFIEGFNANKKDQQGGENTPWHCFRTLYQSIGKLKQDPK